MKQAEILSLLPEIYGRQLSAADWDGLEELRLGSGRPLYLRYGGKERELWPLAGQDLVEEILQRACRHSVYAYAETVRQGYMTVEGGHRIGICGFGVRGERGLEMLRSVSSVNIRIAREIRGCAASLLPHLNDSVLLLGPPGSGKTTLLRDAVRQLSDRRRQIVGLADERGELSAVQDGCPQLCVGSRTDVLVNVPKAEAVMILLRTMNPMWIAMDEITAPEDLTALEQASYCGVRLLATAHGDSMEDLYRRPIYRTMIQTGIFRRVAVLRPDKSYTVEEVGA